MPEGVIPKIISSLRTTEERDALYEAIGDLEVEQYRVGGPEEGEILKRVSSSTAALLESILRGHSLNKNHIQKKDFLKNLRDRLKALRVLKIDLAFEPKPLFLNKLSTWVKKNVGEDTLLEIGFDKTLVGGARIIFGGRYIEETLEKLLMREFEANRNIIVGLSLRKPQEN